MASHFLFVLPFSSQTHFGSFSGKFATPAFVDVIVDFRFRSDLCGLLRNQFPYVIWIFFKLLLADETQTSSTNNKANCTKSPADASTCFVIKVVPFNGSILTSVRLLSSPYQTALFKQLHVVAPCFLRTQSLNENQTFIIQFDRRVFYIQSIDVLCKAQVLLVESCLTLSNQQSDITSSMTSILLT